MHHTPSRTVVEKKRIPAFTEVTFSYERGNDVRSDNIKISSHSKHLAEESVQLTENDKRVLAYLLKEIKKN